MKSACLIGICFSLMIAVPASAGTYWAKQYGTSQYDGVSTVLETNDGGFIVGGNTHESKTDRNYAWVMKLGASGSVIWQKRFGSKTHTLGVAAVLPMADNGFIVVGNATLLPDKEDVSHYVMKLDSNGKIKWQKSIRVAAGLSLLTWAGRQTNDGGCIVTGVLMDEANDDLTGYMMKIQPAGTLEWIRQYDTGRGCGFFMGEQTPDGGYIVAGYMAASSRDNDVDGWLVKTDASGNILWQKRYGARIGFDMFSSIRITTDGGYIAAGMYAYDGEDSSSQWLVKLDAVGNVKWQKALGSKYIDLGILVTQTIDGGYAMSGGIGADAETSIASIVKLDSNGGLTWRRTLDRNYPGVTWSVWQTADGGYISGVLLTSEDDINAIVLRLSSTGDIASTCGALLSADKYTISNTSTKGLNTSGKTLIPNVTVSAGTLTPYSSKAGLNTLCESTAFDEY